MGKIYKGDVGKEFRVDTEVDCSTAIKTEVHVLLPDETTTTWTATPITNPDTGIDSILKYITTQASELDQLGMYTVVSYVEFSVSSKHYGEPDTFVVYDIFK